ncbi:MAG: hypothetical protein HYU29_01270 [Chloroflexi bacterium]|nr:hypothetical protein [Chloroflexota bacterium]
MEGRDPPGILLVMADLNGRDEGRLLRWLFTRHLPGALAAGGIQAACFYKNAGRPGDTPISYLFIYEVGGEPINERLAQVEQFFRFQLHLPSAPPLDIRHLAPYHRAGPPCATTGKSSEVRALCAAFIDAPNAAQESGLDRWCDQVLLPQVPSGGRRLAAYRFRNLRPDGQPARHLVLCETALDITSPARPQRSASQERQECFSESFRIVLQELFVPLRAGS